MEQLTAYPAVFYRGGTSKALLFRAHTLPADPAERDRTLLAALGSPDPRQIDGMGGADAHTSKIGIIGASARPDADVDYTFGQISPDTCFVDYTGNCGNISSAIGPFAIDEGLVAPVAPVTTVRIFNTNTQKLIYADVPVQDGRTLTEGDFRLDGVPGTAAKIVLRFIAPGGAVTGRLLPSGQPKETVRVPQGRFDVSFIDASNPVVFVRAADMGLSGVELPAALNARTDVLATLEALRALFAVRMGLCARPKEARIKALAIPKVCLVAPAQTYATSGGSLVHARDMDLAGRLFSLQKPHKAYAVTGAICTGAAARIPGTIVHELLPDTSTQSRLVRIGHPGGVITIGIEMEDPGPVLRSAVLERTARRLMDGKVYVSSRRVRELQLA